MSSQSQNKDIVIPEIDMSTKQFVTSAVVLLLVVLACVLIICIVYKCIEYHKKQQNWNKIQDENPGLRGKVIRSESMMPYDNGDPNDIKNVRVVDPTTKG